MVYNSSFILKLNFLSVNFYLYICTFLHLHFVLKTSHKDRKTVFWSCLYHKHYFLCFLKGTPEGFIIYLSICWYQVSANRQRPGVSCCFATCSCIQTVDFALKFNLRFLKFLWTLHLQVVMHCLSS